MFLCREVEINTESNVEAVQSRYPFARGTRQAGTAQNRTTLSKSGDQLPSLVCIMNYNKQMGKFHLVFKCPAISSACCATVATSLQFYTRNTFMTSSPRWLMTFTAMRPEAGLLNGYETSLFRVSQASLLISALSVVLRAL